MNAFAAKSESRGITVQHEPRREADKGAPDFKIKSRGMILGYVEVKEVSANLDKVLKSDQIKRYRTLSDTIILTNYLEFLWIGPGRRTVGRGSPSPLIPAPPARPLRASP